MRRQRKKAVNEVKDEIGGMAMEIASKVVEREIKEADHQDLIDEFIKNVGEHHDRDRKDVRRKPVRPGRGGRAATTRILGELEGVTDPAERGRWSTCICSASPASPKKERCALLDEALRGQVHLYALNFMKILCEKGTLAGAARLRPGLPVALQ